MRFLTMGEGVLARLELNCGFQHMEFESLHREVLHSDNVSSNIDLVSYTYSYRQLLLPPLFTKTCKLM